MIYAVILSGILSALTAISALSQNSCAGLSAAVDSISTCTGQILKATTGAADLAAYDGTIADNTSSFASNIAVGGVNHHTYYSAALKINIGYNIYLPPEYAKTPSRRFPVLYFLHGRDGDENSSPNQIVATYNNAANVQPMIIVFVNGGKNSKYMDPLPGSKLNGVWKAEHTIINELIPAIDSTYRTVAHKQGRAIQGFSMGGMGALRLAFKYPNLFGSVYAFAPAADDNASNVATNEPALLAQMFNGNTMLFAANEPQNEALANPGSIKGLSIHIIVGSADSLLPTAQDMVALLESLKIPHDPLETINGVGHDLGGLQAATKRSNYQFASDSFAVTGDLKGVGR